MFLLQNCGCDMVLKVSCIFLLCENQNSCQTHQCSFINVNEGICDSGQGIIDLLCMVVLYLIAERQVQHTLNPHKKIIYNSSSLSDGINYKKSKQSTKQAYAWLVYIITYVLHSICVRTDFVDLSDFGIMVLHINIYTYIWEKFWNIVYIWKGLIILMWP